jgi:hypothetical protein
MALQSEFHEDLSKFEPNYWGSLTKQKLFMVLKLIPAVIVLGAEVVFIHGPLYWFLAFVTSALLVVPPVVKGLNKWQKWQHDFDYSLIIQDRYYQAGNIRRYQHNEFTQTEKEQEINHRTET